MKRSLCRWNQPHFLRNSDKSLFISRSKPIETNQRHEFCRRKTAQDDNTKINVFSNIRCTFLLFKGRAFLQIFFPITSKFWERQFSLIVNVWYTYFFNWTKRKDTLWNFSFRTFHEIQFQGHFMKHEILSWNIFTLVSNIHCVYFSPIKKLCLQRKDIV